MPELSDTYQYGNAPWPGGNSTFASVTLASAQTTTGGTDYIDLAGYVSKCVITVINGATNAVSVKVEGSHDGTTWSDVPFLAVDDAAGTLDTVPRLAAESFAASGTGFLFLVPGQWPRYIRANVTSANAVGTALYLHAER